MLAQIPTRIPFELVPENATFGWMVAAIIVACASFFLVSVGVMVLSHRGYMKAMDRVWEHADNRDKARDLREQHSHAAFTTGLGTIAMSVEKLADTHQLVGGKVVERVEKLESTVRDKFHEHGLKIDDLIQRMPKPRSGQ